MATGRGAFGAYIKKLMAEAKGNRGPLRARDIALLTANKVNDSRMHSILNGTTPRDVAVIDALAEALGADRQVLRNLAARDWALQVVADFMADKSKILGRSSATAVKLPLVQSKDLNDILSADGYPMRYTHEIQWNQDLGPRAYAFIMNDDALHPKAEVGDICIVKPAIRVRIDEFGFVGSKERGIVMGRLGGDKNNFQVTRGFGEDHDIVTLPRTTVRYVFRVEGWIRGDLRERRSRAQR